MWKIPVRGPSAASLKPSDLYTGKGIQKARVGKLLYIVCLNVYLLSSFLSCAISTSFLIKLLQNKRVTLETILCFICKWYYSNFVTSVLIVVVCFCVCVCITLKWIGECRRTLLPAPLRGFIHWHLPLFSLQLALQSAPVKTVCPKLESHVSPRRSELCPHLAPLRLGPKCMENIPHSREGPDMETLGYFIFTCISS